MGLISAIAWSLANLFRKILMLSGYDRKICFCVSSSAEGTDAVAGAMLAADSRQLFGVDANASSTK